MCGEWPGNSTTENFLARDFVEFEYRNKTGRVLVKTAWVVLYRKKDVPVGFVPILFLGNDGKLPLPVPAKRIRLASPAPY